MAGWNYREQVKVIVRYRVHQKLVHRHLAAFVTGHQACNGGQITSRAFPSYGYFISSSIQFLSMRQNTLGSEVGVIRSGQKIAFRGLPVIYRNPYRARAVRKGSGRTVIHIEIRDHPAAAMKVHH